MCLERGMCSERGPVPRCQRVICGVAGSLLLVQRRCAVAVTTGLRLTAFYTLKGCFPWRGLRGVPWHKQTGDRLSERLFHSGMLARGADGGVSLGKHVFQGVATRHGNGADSLSRLTHA